MKKIGLICLALVMALGALGIGYAAWTDSVAITGSVTTGSLDLEVVGYSGDWVWKIPSTGALVRTDTSTPPSTGAVLVAYGKAEQNGSDPKAVLVTFNNLFPCQVFVADILLHVTGTIPSIVQVDNLAYSGAAIPGGVEIKYYNSDASGTQGTEITGGLRGKQYEGCQYILILITIHIPDTVGNAGQGITGGSVSGTISTVQWNEYVP